MAPKAQVPKNRTSRRAVTQSLASSAPRLAVALFVFAALASTAPAQRVTNDLQALYTFEEGSGTAVNDVSGVGTALNLTIRDPGSVSWIAGGGLAINAETMLESGGPASKIIAACKGSNELTVEAWVTPGNLDQDGPARMVVLSDPTNGPSNRNFTMGENYWAAHDQTPEPTYIMRVRTSTTNSNGSPELDSGNQTLTLNLTHVVFTHDTAGNELFYLDGAQSNTGTRGGDFSTWADNYQFALVNEHNSGPGERDWVGELHLVAVYSRALTPTEVLQNFNAGPHAATTPPTAPSNLTASAVSSVIISLGWTDNSANESGFEIQRKEGTGGSYALIATVGANAEAYSDIGLDPETTYFYQVRAVNAAGESAWSSEASATTPASSLNARNWHLYD